jgi:hypothetical protein
VGANEFGTGFAKWLMCVFNFKFLSYENGSINRKKQSFCNEKNESGGYSYTGNPDAGCGFSWRWRDTGQGQMLQGNGSEEMSGC